MSFSSACLVALRHLSMNMSSHHVLVVDDRVNMLQLLAKVLRDDAVVHTAKSGAEAVGILEAQPVGVVVCDLRMPDMTGIDVMRACKRLQPTSAFVLMTAYASVPTAVRAMREGAYDYIIKPFDPDKLRAIVLSALSRVSREHLEDAETPDLRHEVGAEPSGGHESVENLAGAPSATDSAQPALDLNLVSMTWQEAIDLGRKEAGRQYLQAVLEKYGGRVADAAVHAGVERESFYRLLRKYGVQLDRSSEDTDE